MKNYKKKIQKKHVEKIHFNPNTKCLRVSPHFLSHNILWKLTNFSATKYLTEPCDEQSVIEPSKTWICPRRIWVNAMRQKFRETLLCKMQTRKFGTQSIYPQHRWQHSRVVQDDSEKIQQVVGNILTISTHSETARKRDNGKIYCAPLFIRMEIIKLNKSWK